MARDVLGLDISGQHLRFAAFRSVPGKLEAYILKEFSLKGFSEAQIIETLSPLLAKMKLRHPRAVGVISSNVAITKNIEIPSVDPQEIANIVSLQATRHTPYPREEIIVDHINIGTYKGNYSKVLLVIIPRKVVNKYIRLFALLNLDVETLVFAPEVLALSLSKRLGLESQDSPVGILHVDSIFSEFVVVLKRKVIFVRSFPLGAEHLRGGKEIEGHFLEEVKNSLEAYSSEDIEKPLNGLVLSGCIEALSSLDNSLSSEIPLPLKSISWKDAFSATQDVESSLNKVKEVSFMNVFSSLESYPEAELDLVPEELKLKRVFELRSREIIKTGVLILVGLFSISVALIGEIYTKEKFLGSLNNKLKTLEKSANRLQREFDRIKIVKKFFSVRNYSLEVLRDIYKSLPQGVKLTNIRFDRKSHTLSLKGTANSMSVIFDFVDKLENSLYIRNVRSERTTRRKVKETKVVDFDIRAELVEKV